MSKTIITLFIYAYRALSPVVGTNACCRFEVSCSEYALRAFHQEPFLSACIKTAQRILACNPFRK